VAQTVRGDDGRPNVEDPFVEGADSTIQSARRKKRTSLSVQGVLGLLVLQIEDVLADLVSQNQGVTPVGVCIVGMVPKGTFRWIFGVSEIDLDSEFYRSQPRLLVQWLIGAAVTPPGELATVKPFFTALPHDVTCRSRIVPVRNAVHNHVTDGKLALFLFTAGLEVNIQSQTEDFIFNLNRGLLQRLRSCALILAAVHKFIAGSGSDAETFTSQIGCEHYTYRNKIQEHSKKEAYDKFLVSFFCAIYHLNLPLSNKHSRFSLGIKHVCKHFRLQGRATILLTGSIEKHESRQIL
jgi:hypothetical protein